MCEERKEMQERGAADAVFEDRREYLKKNADVIN